MRLESEKIKKYFSKIILIIIIASILFLIFVANSYSASINLYKYDLDNNEKIEKEDAIKIIKHIVSEKTNKNDEWIINQENIDLKALLEVLRYIEAENDEQIANNHEEWLKLRKTISLNVKNKVENLNLTTNKQTKIQIQGENYGVPKFKVKDESIVTVNEEGIITAIKEGSTIVEVYDEYELVSEEIKVNVSDVVENIKINKTNIVLDISGINEEILQVEGNIEKDLIWDSSDSTIAIINENGKVKGLKNGECNITVTTRRGNKATCRVKVVTSPTAIKINKDLVSLIVEGNKEFKLLHTLIPNTANINTNVTYKSSNDKIATVDEYGKITAIEEGSTIIEVTTENNKKATCKVNVLKEEVSPIVSIKKSYEGDIVTSGDTVNYEILIKGNNIKNVDTSKIKKTGTLASKATGTITGEGNSYNLEIKIPDETGTIGFEIEEGFITNISGNTNKKATLEEQNSVKFEKTTTENSITAAIGVTNSFYVKDYDFYIDNKIKEENRTTNEYTYSNLEEGKTYKIKIHINMYKNKETNDTIEGWIEKDIKTEKNNGVEVHFINVTKRVAGSSIAGAGDCIFIKTSNGKTIMIDTGAEETNSGYVNFVSSIDKYLRIDKNGKDGNALLKEENGIVNIDYLILTHAHRDHIGGFEDLTGVYYKKSSPGYIIKEDNTINGTKVRYNFGKIILGCNVKKYDSDEEIGNIEDGARGVNTTEAAINKAIYCYAKEKGKLEQVNAGNVLNIDNILLNIYNPYPYEDVPGKWLSSIRSKINTYAGNTLSPVSISEANNNSIVIKLLCGSRKMLLMGDAEFIVEEILLGIPSEQIKNNDSSKARGLRIDSSNGGRASPENTYTDYTSLVSDLILERYEGCKTITELEDKYRISRLTPKDLSAQVLKRGHHGVANTTSIPFLNKVRPNKIVSTGESSSVNYKNSIIGCVNTGPDYCIRSYYNSSYSGASSVGAINFNGGQIKLTSNNWYYFIFGTDNISDTDGNDRGKGSFYIKTNDGKGWDYSDPYSK